MSPTAKEKEAVLRVGGYDAQLKFWQSCAKYRAFIGGIGSGKSMASVVEMFRQPAGSQGAIVAPTYQTLTRGLIELAFKHFEPLISGYNKSDKTLRLVNGTKVYLLSGERIENARGANIDWFGLDEGALCNYEVWTTMIGRLRASKNPRAWITSTPSGLNWVYEAFVRDHADDLDYFLIHAKTDDNPFLPKDNVAGLRKDYASALAAQELDGLFVDLSNTRVNRDWFQYASPPIDSNLPIKLGVDLASSLKTTADYTAIVASCFDAKTGSRYVLDAQRDRKTFHGAQEFIKQMAEKWNPAQINIEKVGYQHGAIQELLRTTSLPIKAYTPKGDKLQRFLSVEGQLENGHVFFAPGLGAAFEDELLSFPNGKHDDLVDALVMSLDIPNRREIRLLV